MRRHVRTDCGLLLDRPAERHVVASDADVGDAPGAGRRGPGRTVKRGDRITGRFTYPPGPLRLVHLGVHVAVHPGVHVSVHRGVYVSVHRGVHLGD